MKSLIFALLVVAARAANNPLCPEPEFNFGICVFDPEVNCLDDSKCTNGQICCSEGCNKRCMDPKKPPFTILPIVKQGTCPAPPPLALTSCIVPITDSCNTDSECKGADKCCKHPCGTRCQSPAGTVDPFPPIKPAPPADNPRCPQPDLLVTICLFDPDVNCLDDSKCTNGQICCSAGCSKRCMDPKKEDSCPVAASGFLVRCAFNDQCSADSDCPNKKCCKGPCGKYCTDAVSIKQGQCPVTKSTGICASMNDDCHKDGDCSDIKKCCKTSCGNRCTGPASSTITRAGTCPVPPNPALVLCAAPLTDKCTNDGDCKGNLKCCENPCGKYCDLVVPKAGNCPKLSPMDLLVKCLSYDRCENDRECPLAQKCCRRPCGHRCTDVSKPAPVPVPITEVKPGSCRRRRFNFRVRCRTRRDYCKNDSGCRGNRKCCKGLCGKRCRRPVRTRRPIRIRPVPAPTPINDSKSGGCPPKPTPQSFCFRFQNDCETDGDCSGNTKCCSVRCGIGCATPTFNRG